MQCNHSTVVFSTSSVCGGAPNVEKQVQPLAVLQTLNVRKGGIEENHKKKLYFMVQIMEEYFLVEEKFVLH